MNVPIVWSIAGSDSGAGAGLQADLKSFEALDVHGCTAVAAITAQNTVAVERVDAVATDLLEAQLAALASDLPPRAIKTGLLGSVDNIRCVARWVDRLRERHPVALVVDPVWRASTGAQFSDGALRQALLEELVPRATVLTPNRVEAAWLLGWGADLVSFDQVEQAAAELRQRGARAVVITGGDAGGEAALDWMDTPQAQGWLSLPRVDTAHHHGSGCTHAASLAAALALDFCTADAAVLAKMCTTQALLAARPTGHGAGGVRPLRGFALQPELLPMLHHSPHLGGAHFLPLAQRIMGLYPIVDSADWIERVLQAGVRTVQLRIKADDPRGLSPQDLSAEIQRSVQAGQAARAQVFINDHWELALEHGAFGVHLGQEDIATADLPALRAAGLRLGLSTHSPWEVCRARAWRPSYIACGPIHATTTKDMPWQPQGPDNLAYWCHVLREPVVAIGGMDIPRSQEAVRCGAAGVAVLRGVVQSDTPEQAIQDLQVALTEAVDGTPWAVPALPRSTLVGTLGA